MRRHARLRLWALERSKPQADGSVVGKVLPQQHTAAKQREDDDTVLPETTQPQRPIGERKSRHTATEGGCDHSEGTPAAINTQAARINDDDRIPQLLAVAPTTAAGTSQLRGTNARAHHATVPARTRPDSA